MTDNKSLSNMTDSSKEPLCLIVSREQGKIIRHELERRDLFDDTHKLMPLEGGKLAIPVKQDRESVEAISTLWPDCPQSRRSLPASQKTYARLNTPLAKLTSEVERLMLQHSISDDLRQEIPKKWERHQDLVILPASSFISDDWNRIPCLWEVVARCLSCQRLARHAPIANDKIRSSQVSLLLGSNSQVTSLDNGIRYSYDVTKCMYSAGNITEKLRIAGWDCSGQIVVDLYAGIGYFTLPYLVHAQAAHVHACEWNPHAVSALRQNLRDNNVSDRCTVHEGDSRQLNLPPVADRVNLGLIPSSEGGWPTAVRVLSWRGGVLHIHSNVEEGFSTSTTTERSQTTESTTQEGDTKTSETDTPARISGKERLRQACHSWARHTQAQILSLLNTIKGSKQWEVRQVHLEFIKSYAPHIAHVVLDLACYPAD